MIQLEVDKTHKKLKIQSQEDVSHFPYYKVLGKKGSNEATKKV
jgi:hypothetical protein